MAASEHKCRRWLQFTLRTLLGFVLLASIGMSWLAVKVNQATQQREAVEAIRKLEGMVGYSYQFGGGTGALVPDAKPSVPAWLRARLGDDFFYDVTFVKFSGRAPVTDSDLRHVAGLKDLQSLILTGNQITDAGLGYLDGLLQLGGLMLDETQVTDAGLERVKGLSQLQELIVRDTPITDAGLEHLKALPNLQVLFLMHTKVTDAGLKRVGGLSQLKELRLEGDQFTDTGLENLKGLRCLESLALNNTRVTEEGVNVFQREHPNCAVSLTFP